MNILKNLCTLIIILLIPTLFYAQGFGLQFYGHEKQLDDRTGLELNENDDFHLKNNFKLEFDLTFSQNEEIYFGYILRIVAEDEINIDIVYDHFSNMLNIIEGNSANIISIPVTVQQLSNWKKVSIAYVKKENRIDFSLSDSIYSLTTNLPENRDKWKFYFGVNHSKNFKTTDLPSMRIRNIKLYENNKIKHNWLLNNQSGTVIKDEIGKSDAVVENPLWLHSLHENWKLEKKMQFSSYTQFTQKNNSDSVYFLSTDSLFVFQLSDLVLLDAQKLAQKINLEKGAQIIYNNKHNNLSYYSINQNIISDIDLRTLKSSKIIPKTEGLTEYWHHNKYFNSDENKLCLLAGYGQLTYKNSIHHIDLNEDTWTTSTPNNSDLSPRYLSSLGANLEGDTLYIFGGYGSKSGDQKINPGYVRDLIRLIPKENKVEKIYNLENSAIENFCLSNSMIVDNELRLFYALSFSKYEYENELRLIKGSLDQPLIIEDSKSIPFKFHDIMSYVDLIYSPAQQKLYAITLFNNDNEITKVEIYSILFPPNVDIDTAELSKPVEIEPFRLINLVIIFIGFITIIVLIIIFRKLEKRKLNKENPVIDKENPVIDKENESVSIASEKSTHTAPPVHSKEEISQSVVPDKNYSIKLFGGFNIRDKEGNNITNKFTPLLKELFLLIFLNSNDEKSTGIYPAKLKEFLWYDKSEKDASNNRAVNIARLKSLLMKLGDISISKATGYWKIEYGNDPINTDYSDFLRITKLASPSKEDILVLMQVTKNGDFLHNLSFEWLDNFKSDVSNRVIDTFVEYLKRNAHKCDPSFIVEITDTIFVYDSVDEDALSFQCQSLFKLGKHSSAKKVYARFTKEYKILYNEDYSRSFNEILN